jgi:DNA modification methylase
MAKIEITKTELVWPGKYNEDGTLKEVPRVSLPFQVIETVNESRATREARKGGVQQTLFDVWEGKEGDTFEEGWRNKLIWGDNLLVMGSLLEKFAGKIDLIYIDPPFATGADFSFLAQVGDEGFEIEKEQSILEELAYRDTWGGGTYSYLSMILPRLRRMYELLSPSGSLVVHVDYRLVSQIRLLLDETFGAEHFRNEIVWHYHSGGISQEFFPRKHDSLLWYCKGDVPYFDSKKASVPRNVCQECGTTLDKWNNLKRYVDKDGRVYRTIKSAGKVYVYYDDEPVLVPDVWLGINHLQQKDPERTGFLTQKPEKLLHRIIGALSPESGLVADFFCGSGTTLAVAEKLGRRWIGCDLGRWGIHVTRKRLLGIENCKPFEVLNLGKYERQYWQGVTFGDKKGKPLCANISETSSPCQIEVGRVGDLGYG